MKSQSIALVYLVNRLSETSIPVRLIRGFDGDKYHRIVLCISFTKIKTTDEGLKVYSLLDFHTLVMFLKNYNSIIIHAHHTRSALIGIIIKKLKIIKGKFCFTLHSNYTRYSIFQKLIFSYALKWNDLCIFNSFSTLESVPARYRRKVVTSKVIYNGVEFIDVCESALINRLENLKQLKSLKIGLVGRLESIKNVDLALKVVAELRGREIKIKVDIIGDGNEMNKLKELSSKIGIKDLCEFHGTISHYDVLRKYPEFDVVIILSSQEGFCNVAVEAASQGCALILSDIAVFKEIYRDANVIFADDSDPKRIADLFECRREKLNLAGLIHNVRDSFSFEQMIALYSQAYTQQLNLDCP